MIILRSSRQDAETILRFFFPVINLYKQTRLINASGKDKVDEAFLSAIIINCELTEIEKIFSKKLINTIAKNIIVKLTDSQAVVLYKALLAMPVDPDKIYFQLLRNQWVENLDHQLILLGIFKFTRKETGQVSVAEEQYFE